MSTTNKLKLSRAMEVVKSEDLDGHKSIWSFSSEHMKPNDIPPISALVYGARRILLPEMHWESTPDLLDIFALADLIRQQTLKDAIEALEWDQFYRKGGEEAADGIPLTDQERKKLQSVVKKASDKNIRSVYRTVVMQLCWAHIHLIRRSRETYQILHVFRRYFPSTAELEQREPSIQHPLWLCGFSESELIEYDDTRRRLKYFLQDAEEWEQKFFKDLPDNDNAHAEARMNPEYQSRFCEKFSLLVTWDKLVDIILRHLNKIQTMASGLHSIFSDESAIDVDAAGSSVSPILGRSQNRPGVSSSQPYPRREVERVHAQNQDTEKKESQESNVSSKLSYVDTPSNIGHAPPTSLLQRRS